MKCKKIVIQPIVSPVRELEENQIVKRRRSTEQNSKSKKFERGMFQIS